MTRVFVGLGSNLGNRRKHLETALTALDTLDGLRPGKVSSFYETDPVGCESDPLYWNAVVEGCSELSPRALLDSLLAIESAAGRPREGRSGPRTLDLDLLFHGSAVLDSPGLTLPHPRLARRAFVLVPLAEIAPYWAHPVLGCTMTELLAELGDQTGVRWVARGGVGVS